MRWDKDSRFEINRVVIKNRKIKKPVTFAVIADLHNCCYGRDNRRLFDTLVKEEPDAVLIAGDLIEAGINASEEEGLKLLYMLSGRFPVYYGVGNHEKKLFIRSMYQRQRDELVFGLKRSGVRLMHNTSYELPDSNVCIKGLDIPHEYYRRVIHKKTSGRKLEGLLGRPDRKSFNILLAHDPSHFKAYAEYGADLVLSGHVHGGMVRLPYVGGLFSPEYRLFPKYDAGIYRLEHTRMLVSRGLGSHTINIRINNTPELIMLRLERDEKWKR